MTSKFITAPLIILIILAMLSLIGLGTGILGSFNMSTSSFSNSSNAQKYFYDDNGNPKVYANNLTNVAETGTIVHLFYILPIGAVASKYAGWENTSGTYGLFLDTQGKDRLAWTSVNVFYTISGEPTISVNKSGNSGTSIAANINFDIGAAIAILSAVMVIAALVGLQVVGSSASNDTTSAVILKFGAFLGTWGIFSGLSYALLVQLPLAFGSYFYLIITILFVIGLIDSIGHPSH
jgi:hypothetical protein